MGFLKAVKKFLELEDAEDNNNSEEIEASAETEVETVQEEDEEELIAVITAAIAASLGRKSVEGFRVISFKKRGDWNKQAYL